MKVLFDHNLSPRLARALAAFYAGEHEAVALRDKFQVSASDVEWMGSLGREGGWCVVSGDQRIARNRIERQAFRDARLIGFFLSRALIKSPVERQLIRLLALWPAMAAASQALQGSALFELPLTSTKLRQISF